MQNPMLILLTQAHTRNEWLSENPETEFLKQEILKSFLGSYFSKQLRSIFKKYKEENIQFLLVRGYWKLYLLGFL